MKNNKKLFLSFACAFVGMNLFDITFHSLSLHNVCGFVLIYVAGSYFWIAYEKTKYYSFSRIRKGAKFSILGNTKLRTSESTYTVYTVELESVIYLVKEPEYELDFQPYQNGLYKMGKKYPVRIQGH
jgi:hypothetical protein